MEKIIKLYSYVDGINDTPFPSNDNQIESEDFQYNAKRMGGTPSISVSLYWPECIDKSWAYNVYARFNGERYFLKQLPTSGKDNTDARYKYDIELVSERIILDNVYVYDVVSPDADYDKPVSNGSKFTFFGTVHEFARRLNYSLEYCKVGYSVVVDDGISSDGKMVSFEDQFFSNAIQEAYNTYEIPYYFVGKVIHIGFTNNAITETFKYGAENSLMSIQKQNANYKIVTRVTGTGSSDNIPPYYPNDSADRAAIEAAGGTWILPSDKLMPPVYRDTFGRERFYNAKNNTYISPQTGDYYHFDNEYVEGNPKEHIVNFEHIKPSIVGMTNSLGFRIDKFVDFAYDTNDNDDVDEEGNYIHPYFFAKLRKMDGDYGFNLFEHAIEGNDMAISMTGGSCGACEWTIMVDEDTMKNTVQVDSDGNILRDENGNVKFGEAQDRQNDTKNYEVWIALKKDIDTFGVVMPNASGNYKPSTDDTFVILHINLPKAYILAAENKLMEEMIKYMATNNNEKFNFSIKFSRIYLEEHPDVLSKLNENARIQIEYDGTTVELYVSSFSYKASKSDILPEITVELSDTLTVAQNALQTAINDVKQDIMSSVGSIDWLKLGLAYFLRKDQPDQTRHLIKFLAGLYSKHVSADGVTSDMIMSSVFSSGAFGSGFTIKQKEDSGHSYIEVDELYVRLKAYFDTLEIKHLSHVGGRYALTPAGMECIKVEKISYGSDNLHDSEGEDLRDLEGNALYAISEGGEEAYRCFFRNTDGEKTINNMFAIGDQAQCREFNVSTGVSHGVSNRYYWRLVTGIGNDYIDLSVSDCDNGSDIPEAGDTIVTVGNRNDPSRGNVIMLSSYDDDAPSIKLYSGINSYSMVGKEKTVLSPNADKNLITGKLEIRPGSSGFSNLIDAPDMEDISDRIDYANNAAKDASKDAEEAKDAVDKTNVKITNLREYVDGAFSDGIISEAESVAIEKYKNAIQTDMKTAESSYQSLKGNAYIDVITQFDLISAYNRYKNSADALLQTIETAIADKAATTEEIESVNSAYSLYSGNYAILQDALESANHAIQIKVSEEKANAVEKSLSAKIADVSESDKNSMAASLGYADYNELLEYANKGNTIIEGGKIRTSLIESSAIVTSQLIANAIKAKELNVGGKFKVFTDGSVDMSGTMKTSNGAMSAILHSGFLRIEWDGTEVARLAVNLSTGAPELTMQHNNNTVLITPTNILFRHPGGTLTLNPEDIGNGRIVKDSNGALVLDNSLIEGITVGISASPAEWGTTNPAPTNMHLVQKGSSEYVEAIPNEGYMFDYWSDGGAQTHLVVWDEHGKKITAYFKEKPATTYTVTLYASPPNGGTVSGGGTKAIGSTATVYATPAEGYVFKRWSDGGAMWHTVTWDSNKSLTAYFERSNSDGSELLAGTDLSNKDYVSQVRWGNGSIIVLVSNNKIMITCDADSAGCATFNAGMLANKIVSGHKYRLTVKAYYTGAYTVPMIACIASSYSNGGIENIIGSTEGAIYTSLTDTEQTYTVDIAANRDSTSSDAVCIYTGKGVAYITGISLKEL